MDPEVRAELDALERRVAQLEARAGAPSMFDSQPGWSQREFGDGTPADDPEVVAFLRDNKKINAIKAYRERTGLGLAEAKDAVEEIERRLGL